MQAAAQPLRCSGASCPPTRQNLFGMQSASPSPASVENRLEKVRPPPIVVSSPAIPVSQKTDLFSKVENLGFSTPTPSQPSGIGGGGGQKSKILRQERVPVGNMGRVPLDAIVDLNDRSQNSTPAVPFTSVARVNMVGSGPAVMGVANPLLSEALRASSVRKFTGRAEDFEDFEREWNFHLKLMFGATQGTLPDTVVLMTLKNYLDEASQALLHGEMSLDPDLSYYDFWEKLKCRFLRDARAIHRQNWRAVKLTPNGKVTLQDWLKFQAIYTSKRVLVEDWSDAEDQQLVFSQVPPGLQAKVLTETRKRRNDKSWVRVVFPSSMSLPEVKAEMEAELGFTLRVLSQDRRHFVVSCGTQNEVQALLALDGCKIDRSILKVQRAEYSMTGDDIFQFVRRLLETDEELEVLRRSYGCEVPPSQSVRAVQVDPGAQKDYRYFEKHAPSSSSAPVPPKSRQDSGPGKGSASGPRPRGETTPVENAPETPSSSAGKGKGKSKGKGNGHGNNSFTPFCPACKYQDKPFEHDRFECENYKSFRAGRRTPEASSSVPVTPQTLERSE